MKKLLLIRHAKATHKAEYADFDRPLKGEGRDDAKNLAKRLKENGILPELFVASPSLRTQMTADIITEYLDLPKAENDESIYDSELENLVDIVQNLPDSAGLIALVGHNPGIAYLSQYLTYESRDITPGTAVLIEFEIDAWQHVGENSGTLKWFASPKDED